jgi:hypothetical protein
LLRLFDFLFFIVMRFDAGDQDFRMGGDVIFDQRVQLGALFIGKSAGSGGFARPLKCREPGMQINDAT